MKLFRLMREGREEVYMYFANRRCVNNLVERLTAMF